MSILQGVTEFVTEFIESTGVLGVFLIMVAESSILPIPSEIVMPFSGYVAWMNNNQAFAFTAGLAASAGHLVGSVILYYIGAKIGRPFIEKYGKYFLVRKSEIEYAERLFVRYGSYAVFFGRMIPLVRTAISLPAGIFKMNLAKFSVLTFLGSLPWNFGLTYVGYSLGYHWTIVLEYSAYADPIVIMLAAAIVGYIIYSSRKKTGEAKNLVHTSSLS